MNQLPIFMNMQGRTALVVGNSAAAAAKIRLLLKSGARVHVLADNPAEPLDSELAALVDGDDGSSLVLERRALRATDLAHVALVYAATEDLAQDRSVAAMAQDQGLPVNVVDRPDLCSFTTPAVVDRSPIVIAVGTGGASPVLAQRVRAAIDRLLPQRLGVVATIAEGFRPAVRSLLPSGLARRRFWQRFLDGPAAQAALNGDEASARMHAVRLLNNTDTQEDRPGAAALIAIGPGDPELLTLKAHRLLLAADVIFHHGGAETSVLELARRDAEVIALPAQADRADPAFLDQVRALVDAGKAVVHLSLGSQVPADLSAALSAQEVAVFEVPGVPLAGSQDGSTHDNSTASALLPQEDARPASLLEMAFPMPFLAGR